MKFFLTTKTKRKQKAEKKKNFAKRSYWQNNFFCILRLPSLIHPVSSNILNHKPQPQKPTKLLVKKNCKRNEVRPKNEKKIQFFLELKSVFKFYCLSSAAFDICKNILPASHPSNFSWLSLNLCC